MSSDELMAMLACPPDIRGECDECGGYRELWDDDLGLLSLCSDCWMKAARRKAKAERRAVEIAYVTRRHTNGRRPVSLASQ